MIQNSCQHIPLPRMFPSYNFFSSHTFYCTPNISPRYPLHHLWSFLIQLQITQLCTCLNLPFTYHCISLQLISCCLLPFSGFLYISISYQREISVVHRMLMKQLPLCTPFLSLYVIIKSTLSSFGWIRHIQPLRLLIHIFKNA